MKISISTILFCIGLSFTGISQQFNWALSRPDGKIYHYPKMLASLENNDMIFSSTNQSDSLDIDPGTSIRMVYANEFFIQRFSETKNLIWTTTIHGTSIYVDNCDYNPMNTSIEVTLRFKDTLIVENNLGDEESFYSSGNYNSVIIILDLDGNILSHRMSPNGFSVTPKSILKSEYDKSIFSFNYSDSTVISANGQSSIYHTIDNNYDHGLVIVKTDNSNNIEQSVNIVSMNSTINAIDLLNENIVVSIVHTGSLYINNSLIIQQPSNVWNGTLLKINENGIVTVMYTKTYATYLFAQLKTFNNITYIIGNLDGSFNFGTPSSPYQISTNQLLTYIIALDSNFQPINHILTDDNPNDKLVQFDDNNLYVINRLYQNEDLDPGIGIDSIHVNSGESKVAISEFTYELNYLSSSTFEMPTSSYIRQFSINDSKQLYISGQTAQTPTDIAPGNDIFNVIYTPNDDGQGQFIMKLDCAEYPQSIDEMEENLTATRIFPNPSSGTWFVDTRAFDKSLSVELFDLTGKKIQSNQEINNDLISIQADVPSGIYLLKLSDENGIITFNRLVKN